jgi:curved DNA-binding protein CbpA
VVAIIARRNFGTFTGDGTDADLSSGGAIAARQAGRPSGGGYTLAVAKREPFVVLGIEPGATPSQIKAAWRRLARQHHPDLTGDDPEASRLATRQMAEINEAYAALTRGPSRGTGQAARPRPEGATFDDDTAPPRRGGPPRPKATRPVTGRLDMSGTIRPRNQPLRPRDGRAAHPPGQPPVRFNNHDREPPRASDPTGPLERAQVRDFRRPPPPPLADALDTELAFGKFRGHTLGQVAAFEPSYVDWLARTITRDPELVAAARVVQADLDDRQIARRDHVATAPELAQRRSAGA